MSDKIPAEARQIVPRDPVSKTVRRRCKEVADFIERGEVTKIDESNRDVDKNSAVEDGESENETYSDDEGGEDAESDVDSILEKLGGTQANKPNKTFSENKLREIERRNVILMDKLIKNSQRPNQYGSTPLPSKTTSAAINRKRQQEKINRDNLVINCNSVSCL